ncbi:YhjD/YihY/BrkB family envelope integrity protein [Actinoplanes sp. NPDC051861]|uniref:YhjD/YihY/BrkB family envelope integrity protein n=1 Tax=Actinoplanes sp. NPDC051861 TaxID=3155170 RepID=UPI0034124B86
MTEPERTFNPGRILAAVPQRLRPRAALLLGHRAGKTLLNAVTELVRVQIFDRSMTLAAQAFTSIFPLLIMFGAFLGTQARERVNDLVRLPDSSVRLIDQALSGSRSNAFGLFGALIVIFSATGLARALNRSYRAIWSVPGRRGATSTVWQIGTVLLLVLFLVAARTLGWISGMLPAPRVTGVVMVLLSDFALAYLLPRILLGPGVPQRLLLFTGALFAVVMVAVRAAGSIYLPRALESSAEKYGTIGLAFTYIGWFYVISFCLLITAVLGGLLAPSREHLTES